MTPNEARLMPSTMISKRDYGIKIAKRGFDVNFASDTELLYNSSFPVLAIANYIGADTPREILREGEVSEWNEFNGTYSTRWVYEVRILHGLEYVPLVIPVNAEPSFYNSNVEWDDRYIYIKYSWSTVGDYNSFVSAGRKLNERLMIMAVNIERDIEYPYFDYAVDSTAWGSESDYGFKYLLAGDIDNLNMNELGINPNIQSLMVTAVKVTKDPNKNEYVPDKNLDFRNLSAFCSVRVNGRWRFGGISAQAVAGYIPINNQDGTGFYMIDGLWFGDMVSLVVARMPFISPDKTSYSFVM